MIKGRYADYIIQVKKCGTLIVEVKVIVLLILQKNMYIKLHGANEGMEFALLTNGKNLSSTKYYLGKPIDARRIFSIDISDSSNFKNAADYLQSFTEKVQLNTPLNFFGIDAKL